ncbi:MAG TPA: hypothetical protein VF701_19210 [Thermoanaerobaculia bacterium]
MAVGPALAPVPTVTVAVAAVEFPREQEVLRAAAAQEASFGLAAAFLPEGVTGLEALLQAAVRDGNPLEAVRSVLELGANLAPPGSLAQS